MCFSIKDKQSFHELTSHTEKVFSEIRRYSGLAQFSTLEKLMEYALNDMPQHGTHIYISDLKQSDRSNTLELHARTNDICLSNPHMYSAKMTTSNLVLMQPWLAENSLK